MDSEARDRWIGALRSGDFQQGRGLLIQENAEGKRRHCCLGVKAEIEGIPLRRIFGGHVVAYSVRPDADSDINMAEALGISDEEYFTLVEMNDIEKKNFAEIADYIEEYL